MHKVFLILIGSYQQLGSGKAVPKEGLMTKVGHQLCGTAYYNSPKTRSAAGADTTKMCRAILCLVLMAGNGYSIAATADVQSPRQALSADPSIVVTVDGPIRGLLFKDHRQFLGVPYAAAPVGELRWAEPRPVTPWQAVLEARSFRNACAQASWKAPDTTSEDCLYLNVYAPWHGKDRPTQRVPVMVWFHGGGLTTGSSQDIDASVFAANGDVIVVTLNYRLGAFGFFATPALDAESAEHVSGNQGIRDQQAALKWVQTNIAAFGGDPARVTIAGQSAGAVSAWVHLLSPSSRNLFQQLIAQSYPTLLQSYFGEPFMRGANGTRSIREEEQHGISSNLLMALGCRAPTNALACARSKSTREVLDAIPRKRSALGWSVVYDGVLLPDSVLSLIERGDYKKVPILTGYTARERGWDVVLRLARGGELLSANQYEAEMKALPNGERVLLQYPIAQFDSPENARIAALGDAEKCSALSRAHWVSRSVPFYLYEFADPNPPPTVFDITVPTNVQIGAFHTTELAYIFQTGYPNELHPGAPPFKPDQQTLSDRMLGYWASFVKSGKPTASGVWPAFSSSATVYELIPSGDRAIPEARYGAQHRCSFWRSLATELRN